MNEERNITISTEEYAELMMCRSIVNILSAYVDREDTTHYLDRDFVATILGVPAKGVK